MSGDPVSWLMIEPGWKVVGADGTELGRVEEIVGDTGKDIFSGLAISSGVLTGLIAKPKFVPAERIRSISEERIDLDVSPDSIDDLDDHEPAPPPEELRP
ncbi:MAG TPA: PRC-barrel domain-containing protein [Gaiellaceae bacterium]|nr:PRC-barrel domain-containing protein [Gaiellaceae bacterium]